MSGLLDSARDLVAAEGRQGLPWEVAEDLEFNQSVVDARGYILMTAEDEAAAGAVDFAVASANVAPDLARFALAFAEALPRLRRDHEPGCPTPEAHCWCGAKENNAVLEPLAAMLGVHPDESRPGGE